MSTQKTTAMVPVMVADDAEFEIDTVPARLTAVGLTGAETMLLFSLDGGTESPVTKDGGQVALSVAEPGVAIFCAGDYLLRKGVTVAPAGAYLVQP